MNDSLWNLNAKLYRSVRTGFPFNLILNGENRNLKLLLRSIEIKGKRVVDLGTGTGNVLYYLGDADPCLGIDLTFDMLKRAQQNYPDAKLVVADALKLPIKTDSAELMTTVGLSEYLKDVKPLFKEAYRILKDSGCLLLTFSPPGIWTRLRVLLGHPIYPRTLDELKVIALNEKFHFMRNTHSLMQGQALFEKK